MNALAIGLAYVAGIRAGHVPYGMRVIRPKSAEVQKRRAQRKAAKLAQRRNR